MEHLFAILRCSVSLCCCAEAAALSLLKASAWRRRRRRRRIYILSQPTRLYRYARVVDTLVKTDSSLAIRLRDQIVSGRIAAAHTMNVVVNKQEVFAL